MCRCANPDAPTKASGVGSDDSDEYRTPSKMPIAAWACADVLETFNLNLNLSLSLSLSLTFSLSPKKA
jgi:hypothetical protein